MKLTFQKNQSNSCGAEKKGNFIKDEEILNKFSYQNLQENKIP